MTETKPEPNHLMLGELIETLEAQDPARVLPIGFHRPHSYRGYYEDLAFEITKDITIGDVLDAVRSALGATFTGRKGGDYEMGRSTACWLVLERGCVGESIGEVFLSLLLSQAAPTAPVHNVVVTVTGGTVDPGRFQREIDEAIRRSNGGMR